METDQESRRPVASNPRKGLDDITAKTQKLAEVSGQIAQKAYEAQQAQGEAQPQAEPETAQADDDNVVDADFEEVKDDK